MECASFYDIDSNIIMLNDIMYLKKSYPEKFILLCGNHTCSYIWPTFNAASRTDYKNWEEYNKFFLENLKYFNLVWIENDVIFSHAGISEGWAKRVGKKLDKPDSVIEIANTLSNIPLTEFKNSDVSIISDISDYRGGDMFYGSCEWADLREHIDLKNSTGNNIVAKGEDGIYQVFGHTQLKEPLITDKLACLDCRKGFIIDTITHEITEC